MAFLAVFVALKIAHRAGGYAVWSWIPTICDLRRPEYHLVELKKSVTTEFCSQKVGESDSRVRQSYVLGVPIATCEAKVRWSNSSRTDSADA